MSRKHARLTSLGSSLATLDLRTAQPAPKVADPFYLSADWRQLSKAVVAERGRRCEDCGKTGCRLFVDHVHEIRDGGARLDRRNLRVLCPSCHTAKTARVRAERMRA